VCFAQVVEYSTDVDYMTENIFKALQAGCVPIYHGAVNVGDYIPDTAGVLVYQASSSSSDTALVADLARLAASETEYEAKLAWKKLGMTQLSSGVRQLLLAQSRSAVLIIATMVLSVAQVLCCEDDGVQIVWKTENMMQ
jgi:hypothetical protein